ncbi:Uncharacterized protein SCF082_LOCUS43244 [Durusdinium trenchii]|uniref:Uncharacterized protein n=1 Tax=Durusdinium trenchii TaxID=1381693 RepID=A0ABP0QU70_9DINO
MPWRIAVIALGLELGGAHVTRAGRGRTSPCRVGSEGRTSRSQRQVRSRSNQTHTLSSTGTIPYCRCDFSFASASQTQCETGTGDRCEDRSDIDRVRCFEEGRLCEANFGCIALPRYADLDSACKEATTAEACLEQEACHYVPPSLKYRMACKSRGLYASSPDANDRCDSFTAQGKRTCNDQCLCHWTMDEETASTCKNNGIYLGCVGVDEALNKSCGIYNSAATCQAEPCGLCQWEGRCQCPAEFFGEDCGRELVQFTDRGGSCVSHGDSSACKGLVVAASSQDQHLCTDAQDCSTWRRLKNFLGQMREVEVGQLIVDSIVALLTGFFMACGCEKDLPKNQGFFWAIGVSFITDLFMEGFVLGYAGDTDGALTEVIAAMCFSPGSDAFGWLVKLQDALERSRILVIIQMIISLLGLASNLCAISGLLGFCAKPLESSSSWLTRGCIILVLLTPWLEILLGTWNLWQNTESVFITIVGDLEHSVLGLRSMTLGYACYSRHPDLPETTASGVGWPDPVCNIVLPTMFILVSFLLAAILTRYMSTYGMPHFLTHEPCRTQVCCCNLLLRRIWWKTPVAPAPSPPPPPADVEAVEVEVRLAPPESLEIVSAPCQPNTMVPMVITDGTPCDSRVEVLLGELPQVERPRSTGPLVPRACEESTPNVWALGPAVSSSSRPSRLQSGRVEPIGLVEPEMEDTLQAARERITKRLAERQRLQAAARQATCDLVDVATRERLGGGEQRPPNLAELLAMAEEVDGVRQKDNGPVGHVEHNAEQRAPVSMGQITSVPCTPPRPGDSRHLPTPEAGAGSREHRSASACYLCAGYSAHSRRTGSQASALITPEIPRGPVGPQCPQCPQSQNLEAMVARPSGPPATAFNRGHQGVVPDHEVFGR